MSNDFKQLLLKGTGYSGRGVRFLLLSSTQVDTIREEAAKGMPPADDELPPEARQQLFNNAARRAGIAAMVAQVTTRTGFKKVEELATAEWKPTTVEELTDTPEKYFTTKEFDALGDMFFKLHIALPKEVDDILGEVHDVTVD